MKRVLLLTLSLLFLIFSFILFSPTVSAEEITIPYFIVDFNGVMVAREWPGSLNWFEAFREDRFVPIEGISFELYRSNPALVYDPEYDGIRDFYRLVYTRSDGRKMFVNSTDSFITYPLNEIDNFTNSNPGCTSDDVFLNFAHYETECSIWLQLGVGDEYVFTYPTSIYLWTDLVSQPNYVHPDLGTCWFEAADGSLYLNIRSENGNVVKYSLVNGIGNVVVPNDKIFLTNEAKTSLLSLVSQCSDGMHDLITEVKTLPDCTHAGLQIVSCSKCDYSYEFSIPVKDHSFTDLIQKYEPDCPLAGYLIYKCTGCTKTFKKDLPVKHNYVLPTCTSGSYCTGCGIGNALALGHNLNFWGQCSREGCKGTAVGRFFEKLGEPIGEFVGNLVEKGKDAFDDGKDAIGEKASSFVTTIAVVAGLSIGIPIALFIGRFIKWLKNLKK